MESFKIILVIGLVASAVAVGLAHLMASMTGDTVTVDEIVRNVIISFVITATVSAAMRRRAEG